MITLRILLLVGLGLSSSLTAGPELTIPDSSFDFGVVPQRSRVTCSYWLHSTGTEAVEITKVVSGCGCSSLPLKVTRLDPGDSTRLDLLFDTRMYTQPLRKHPYLLANTAVGRHDLSFAAIPTANMEATYPVIVSPPALLMHDDSESLAIELRNNSQSEIVVRLINTPASYLTIGEIEPLPPGATAKVEVALTDRGKNETFRESVTLEFSGWRQPVRQTIPVWRTVRPAESRIDKTEVTPPVLIGPPAPRDLERRIR